MRAWDHVILDLDGTLLVGDDPLPGAVEAVAALRRRGIGVGFVTNDPVHSRQEQTERLARAGIDADPGEFVTSARALARLAADELGEAAVLCLGSAAFAGECREAGLHPTDDPAQARAVLLGGSDDITMTDLTHAVRAVIVHGAELLGSNRDPTFPATGGPAPGAGALVASVEYATGRRARCAGKPEAAMFEEAREILGPGSYLVVGDRLDADVAGGAAAGMATALVLTGSSDRAQAEAWRGPRPDHVLDGVAGLAALLERQAA